MKAKAQAVRANKAVKLAKTKRQKDGKGKKMTYPVGAKPESSTKGNEGQVQELEVKYVLRKQVRPDPDQPRKTFDQDKLKELADSIKAVGIRQPIQVEWVTGLQLIEPDLVEKDWRVRHGKTVKTFATAGQAREFMSERAKAGHTPEAHYRIVDGERRWRAAELAGVERVPVMVVDTSSAEWEKQKLAVQMVLNQQHENITALEEAAAYQREIESGRHTAESLYKALGISRGTLFSRLALNRVDAQAREALLAGKISVSVAGLLTAVSKEEMKNAISSVAGRSFRDAQQVVEEHYARQLGKAPFDMQKDYEAPAAAELLFNPEQPNCLVRCTVCPRRSGNAEGSGLKNPNVCTLPKCYQVKVEAAAGLKLAEAKVKGFEVLPEKAAESVFNNYGELGTRYDSPFVDLNEHCEPLGYNTKKTWRTALGKAIEDGEVKVTVAIDPSGAVRELVKEEDAKQVLKEEGFKLERDSGSDTSTAEQKHYLVMQRKKKAMEKVAGKASEGLLPKLVGLKATVGFDDRLWPLIAKSVFHHTSIDAHAFVAKRRGLTKVQTDCREKLEKWLKENQENALECARMVVDLMFCAGWNGGGNYSGGPKWDKEFVRACEWAGVKLEKLQEEVEKTGGGSECEQEGSEVK